MKAYFRSSLTLILLTPIAALLLLASSSMPASAFTAGNHQSVVEKGLGDAFGKNTKWNFYYDYMMPDSDQWYSLPAHCTGGDYLSAEDNEQKTYPVSRAEANSFYAECLAIMVSSMQKAVKAGDALVTGNEKQGYQIDKNQMIGSQSCKNYRQWKYVWNSERAKYEYIPSGYQNDSRAKCQVLSSFGRQIHATTDFYAHTNYADQAVPNRPLGINNPPGLNQSEPAALLETYSLWQASKASDLDPIQAPANYAALIQQVSQDAQRIPEKLTSGCWRYSTDPYGKCDNRISEYTTMQKDTSGDWRSYSVSGNFTRATTVAKADVRRQWEGLAQAFRDTYGEAKGNLIVQAMAIE